MVSGLLQTGDDPSAGVCVCVNYICAYTPQPLFVLHVC